MCKNQLKVSIGFVKFSNIKTFKNLRNLKLLFKN